jgi:hypothetical protein
MDKSQSAIRQRSPSMNCTTCDAPLESGAMFCANCGARVTPASSAAMPTVVLPPGDTTQTQSSAPQPYAPPQSYAPPQPYMPPVAPQQGAYAVAAPPTSTTATVSLIFGVLAYVFLPLIGAIIAVVAGHMARKEIRNSGGQIGGSGMATAGLVLGYIQIALTVLAICAIIGIGFLSLLGSRVE